MCRKLSVVLIRAGVALGLFTGMALGQAPDHTHRRAGCPQCVAFYARSSNTPRYMGYYVGGGCAVRGEPRLPSEGTWGWDYRGCWLLPRRIVLGWGHGRRYQGGAGYYKTVGTNLSSKSTP